MRSQVPIQCFVVLFISSNILRSFDLSKTRMRELHQRELRHAHRTLQQREECDARRWARYIHETSGGQEGGG